MSVIYGDFIDLSNNKQYEFTLEGLLDRILLKLYHTERQFLQLQFLGFVLEISSIAVRVLGFTDRKYTHYKSKMLITKGPQNRIQTIEKAEEIGAKHHRDIQILRL